MPSQRRMRVVVLLIALGVLLTLYMTTGAKQTHDSDFYLKTQEALDTKQYQDAARQRDSDDVGARLQAAESRAKEAAEKKNQKYFDSVEGQGAKAQVPVGGKKYSIQGDKTGPVEGVATVGGRPRDKLANKQHESPEEHEVEVELNAILKRSPIIIFSKSYCPHSRKAKHILLEKYNLAPEPHVVELDLHPLGQKLQKMLLDRTGRRTVPNVLVLGKSIGGGDEMQHLDETDTLLDTLKSMAGSRLVQAERWRPQTEMRHRKRAT